MSNKSSLTDDKPALTTNLKSELDSVITPSPGHDGSSSSSYSWTCPLTINELLDHAALFVTADRKCVECGILVTLHSRPLSATPPPTSSHTSSSTSSKLDRNVLTELPKWRKPYKTCAPFFSKLELLFSVHSVTDVTLFKRYLQLSLTELSEYDQLYAHTHITDPSLSLSWAEVKRLFALRFEAQDHITQTKRLYQLIRYNDSEQIQSFSHRFIHLCTESGYNVDDQQTLDFFMSKLPIDVHRRFAMQCQHRETPISSYTTLSKIVADITLLENAHNVQYYASPASSTLSSSSHTPRAAHGAHKSVSLASSKTMHPSSSPSTPAKSCMYHPNASSHNTSECSLYKARHATSFASGTMLAPPHSSTPSSASPFTPAKPITCFNCGKVGHKSPECPSPRAPTKPPAPPSSHFVPSTTRHGTTFSGYTKPAATAMKAVSTTSDTSSSSSSFTITSSDAGDVTLKALDRTIPIGLCALSTREHPALIPIYIQGQLFHGLPDTGASSSCLDPSIPIRFGLTITPVKGKVKMADVTVQSDRIGTVDITAELMLPYSDTHIMFTHAFEVFPVYEYDKGYHFIIGRDMLFPLCRDGLPPTWFTPDSHVKAPTFHNATPSSVVTTSISSATSSAPTSSSLVAVSPVHFNRVEFINAHRGDTITLQLHQVSPVSDALKVLTHTMSDDLQALSHDIHDLGAGVVPDNERPVRPSVSSDTEASIIITSATSPTSTSFDLHSTTPDLITQQHRKKFNQLLVQLSANEAITGFCTLPGAVVQLQIDETKKHTLYRRQYPIPQTLYALANDVIMRWRDTGKIILAPVGCEFNLPLTIAPKKDDNGQLTGIRVCLDTRILNAILISTDKFIIPQIRDTISSFAHCCFFGEFDLSEAYLQFPLHPDSRKYTAFTWNNTQYMFAGVPFGINFIPSHFQRQLSQLFADVPYTMPYFDNLPFASSDAETHIDNAIMIVSRLNSVNLKIKPSSVKIGRSKMKCLGHILSADGIGIDPEKVESIRSHSYPPTGDNMMVFLGETGYISAHIRNYAELTAPLQAVKFHKKIEWTDGMRTSFDTLKDAVCRAPFLQFPDFTLPFHVATDASNTGMGGVLYQPRAAGEHVTAHNIVAIFSKILTEAQRRYPAYKKELLGIVSCLRRFHSYIWGRNDLVIVTDHKPLTYILTSTQLSPSLQQWLDVIIDYNFTIEHRDGILHVLPDRLSRIFTDVYTASTWGVESSPLSTIAGVDATTVLSSLPAIKDDVHINVFLTRAKQRIVEHIAARTAPATSSSPSSSSAAPSSSSLDAAVTAPSSASSSSSLVGEDLASSANNSDDIIEQEIQAQVDNIIDDTHDDHHADLIVEPGIEDLHRREADLAIELEKRGKTIVHDAAQRRDMINIAHLHGHFGVSAVYNKIFHQGYWWPKMRDEIKEELINCDACIRFNVTKSGFHPFTPITALGPGDHYQIDLSTHLPPSTDGYTTLLALIDVYTGFVVLRALRNSEMETVSRELWEIFCLIGWPRVLQSDNGSEFVNQVLRALVKLTGIDHRLISPYNPRADGKVERVIGSTMMIIKKLLHGYSHNWSLYVPFAQVTFNDKVTSLTGSTPFSLLFGRSLNQLVDYTDGDAPVPIPLSDWQAHQERIISIIYPAVSDRILRAKDKLANILTRNRRMLLPASLPPGATVMIKDVTRTNKFEPKYVGPYTIARRAHNGAYVLRDVDGDILDRHIPIDQMKVVSKTGRLKDRNTYTVQKIIDHRGDVGSYEYLVKWKDYTSDYNTWEPQASFNDTNCITKYWATVPSQQ